MKDPYKLDIYNEAYKLALDIYKINNEYKSRIILLGKKINSFIKTIKVANG